MSYSKLTAATQLCQFEMSWYNGNSYPNMLNLFKNFTLKWYQIALYETALISLGIIAGLNWGETLKNYQMVLWLIFLGPISYIIYIYLKQK